jgi:hypothetical protein
MWYILLGIATFLLAMNIREGYVEYQDDKKKVPSVTKPELNAVWKSKIDAEAPIGADDAAYIPPLQAFYAIYDKSELKPTLAQVDAFTKSPVAMGPGVDPGALKKIIISGFHIDLQKAKEETKKDEIDKATADIQSGVLEPKDGRDEVFTRVEPSYQAADCRKGQLPEGIYPPTVQYKEPRRPGYYNDHSAGWTSDQFYGVGDQTNNVL